MDGSVCVASLMCMYIYVQRIYIHTCMCTRTMNVLHPHTFMHTKLYLQCFQLLGYVPYDLPMSYSYMHVTILLDVRV